MFLNKNILFQTYYIFFKLNLKLMCRKKKFKLKTSRKRAYVILIPLNPAFI